MKRILMAVAILGALASTSAADRADDDLAAVKKAVGTTVQAQATVEKEAEPPAAAEAPPRAEKARSEDRRAEPARVAEKARSERHDHRSADKPRSRRGEPQWFRVRIADKSEKHARVSVNLPLDIVRAFGADLDLDDCFGHHTIGDVLRALDSGESLVDIEDEDATVHVWVE